MKLASYIADGKPAFGLVTGGGVITLNALLSGRYATLKEVIAADVQFLDGPSTKSIDLPAAEPTADTDFDDLDIPF